MTTQAMQKATTATNGEAQAIEQVLIGGDLQALSPEQRLSYYQQVCTSLGLNPLTKPFEYITLNGKLTLYARKDATDQLRKVHSVSIQKPDIQQIDDLILVTVSANTPDGRTDADIGVVKKNDMGGNVANAIMKAVTKGKRRVTLSICGLGMLDETEVETIPNAQPFHEERPSAPAAVDAEPVEDPPATADARRSMYVSTVNGLCKQLNEAGDSITWKPKTLKDYIDELFGVDDGMDSLSFEAFDALVTDLEERLTALRS